MKTNRTLRLFSVLAALALTSLVGQSATITKLDNTNALGDGTSWVGGTAPGTSDIATWSGTYNADAAGTNSLRAIMSAGSVSWQGISVGALTGPALTTNTIFAAVTNISAATEAVVNGFNVVTITTKANHGFEPGQSVTIADVTPAGYNGTYIVAGVPAAAQFTYTNVTGSLAAATAFGTVQSAIYLGGAGTATATSKLTVGTSGIDLSGANVSVVINDNTNMFSGSQTWNVPTGRVLRFSNGGVSGATARADTSGSDGLIDITGGGIVSLNQGAADNSGASANSFATFTGSWRVGGGSTLRGIRSGANAWGQGSITLNNGTLAAGGMSGDVGGWTWTNSITVNTGTTNYLADHNVTGTGRYVNFAGGLSGSGNLVLLQPLVAASGFSSADQSFVFCGNNTMSGTLTIGGPAENGVTNRLSFLRVGGDLPGVGVVNFSSLVNPGANGSLGTASVVNNGILTFARTDAHTVANSISGTGSVRIGGTLAFVSLDSQNVTFSGAKTYTGSTTINRGTLTLDATGTIGSSGTIFLTPPAGSSSTLDASAAGFTLNSGQRLVGAATGISQNINGNTVAASGSIIVPGGSNTVGTLTFNNDLALSGGGTLLVDLGATSDSILVNGSLSPSGITTIQATNAGSLANGLYPVITVVGTLNGTPANYAVTGLISGGRGQTFVVVYTNNTVAIEVTGTASAALVWLGDGVANVWSTNTSILNWTNTVGLTNDAFYNGDSVTFDDSGSTTPAVNLTGASPLLPASISVNSANNYRFAGTNGIGGFGTLTKDGAGTLTLASTNTYTGLTTVNAGTLEVTNGRAIADVGAVTLAGGTLQVSASETIRTLDAAAGTTVNVASGTLSYTNGSILGTLTNSGTVVRSGTADTIFGQFTAPDALAFNGTLQLRGSTPSTSPGTMQAATGRFWLHTPGGSQLLGTKFNLDTGLNATNGQDVIFGDWDGTSGNRLLTLNSLTGFGSVRMDAGDIGTRHLIVDQAGTTTFNGMLLAHAGTQSPTNFVRSLDFQKKGAGTLTMANVVGRQTASAGVSNALLTVTVSGGKLGLTATNTYNGWSAVSSGATLEVSGAGQLDGGNYAAAITNNGTLSVTTTAGQILSGVISGTGVLTKASTGLLTLSGVNTYSGATTVSGGSLIGVTTGSAASSAVTVNAGATNGVQVASANGQWACAGLTYAAGATAVDFNIGANIASTSAAPIQVNGNLAFTGTPSVRVNGGVFAAGQYPLYKYTGTLSGTPPTTAASLPYGMAATISNNTANLSIDLVVTVGNVLTWAVGDGAWDINTTANWNNTVPSLVTYTNDQPAQFDDSASGTSPITVTLNTNVSPIAVVANNPAKDYVISGTGVIGGGAGLIKSGAGKLTLSTPNTYTGGSTISAGVVNAQNAGALGAGAVSVASGAALEVQGGITLANVPLTLSGTGIGGAGVLRNINSTNTYGSTVALAANSTIGVDANQLVVSGVISGTNGLTKTGAGTLALSATSTYTGGTVVNNGALDLTGGGGANGTIRGTVTVNSGKTLRLIGGDALGFNANGQQVATVNLVGGTLDSAGGNNQTTTADFILTGGTITGITNIDLFSPTPADNNASITTLASATTSTISVSTINLRQDAVTFDVANGAAATDLLVSSIVGNGATGAHGLTKTGAGKMVLTGANIYTGITIVSNGILSMSSAHTGAGDFTVTDGATLEVSNTGTSAAMGILTLGTAGTATLQLANVASISTPVINAANGVVINGANTITIADTNGLTGVGLYPLVGYGAGLTGSLPALTVPSGVTATLTNDVGNSRISLDVTSLAPAVASNPTNITFSVSGSTLTVSWPATHLGWFLQSQTNSRSIGLSNNWTDIPGSSSVTGVTNTVNPGAPTVFYRLRIP